MGLVLAYDNCLSVPGFIRNKISVLVVQEDILLLINGILISTELTFIMQVIQKVSSRYV